MKTERVSFPGALGHELAARLEGPEGRRPEVYALFAHCFTCSKDLKAVGRISRSLTERGLGVLRFDFTGLGESGGDFSETSFATNVEDLVSAAEYLRRRAEAPRLLIGHSLGGAAVLMAAAQIPEAQAVATLGAPSDTQHLHDRLLQSAPELAAAEEAEVVLAGRKFRIGRRLVDDLREQRVLAAVRELRKPLLILHSPVDETVDVEHAARLYKAASHPKSFVSLDQADHLLLRDPADARYAAEVLAAWSTRYVGGPEADGGADDAAPAEPGVVEVQGGASGLHQEIRAGRHRLEADEPTSAPGGTDRGANPYDFLLAALGACTSMTLRLYADRKKWDLGEVSVRLAHQRIHARDCADCESESGYVGEIRREIRLGGNLDDKQRQRLLEIADRCPVHRTLTSEIKIRSRLG